MCLYKQKRVYIGKRGARHYAGRGNADRQLGCAGVAVLPPHIVVKMNSVYSIFGSIVVRPTLEWEVL